MKSLLFWSLLILVLVSILYVSQISVEGFQTVTYPTPSVVIPKVMPPREELTAGDFKAYTPPSFTLLAPPPGGIATVNTLPYRDPALEKAPVKRILNVLETANGFLRVEAPKMNEMSDPGVQLPLRTLRADAQRLQDEVLVLKRNPGIDSNLTQADVDSIEANLAFLQKKWRQTANSDPEVREGFQTQTEQKRASMSQLKDAGVKIAAEMVRLSASGTTDPVITKRIDTLKAIQTEVNDILQKLEAKTMEEKDVPILEKDLLSFLPMLSSANSALPATLKSANLPVTLASLFPAYEAGDINASKLGQYLLQTYGDTFFKGLSWDMRLNYTAERVKDVAQAKREFAMAAAQALQANAEAQAAASAAAPTTVTGSAGGMSSLPTTDSRAASTPYRGEFAAQTGSAPGIPATITPFPPGTLDWKRRSAEICTAIRKRGYEPGDFGCLEDPSAVSESFSWRGHARMVCARLQTLYDTGAAQACGCPPPTWAGWRP